MFKATLITADRIDIKVLLAAHVIQEGGNIFRPVFKAEIFIKHLLCIIRIDPVQQLVFVTEMIIEGLPVVAALLRDIRNRDFVKALAAGQLF